MNLGGGGGSNNGAPTKHRIMVVADPGRESAGALQWALSHAALEHDHLILLHVDRLASSAASLRKSSTFSTYFRRASASLNNNSGSLNASSSLNDHHRQQQSGGGGGGGSVGDANGEGDFLEAMRAKCEAMQPKVKVQIERVEMDSGRENKAAAILAQSLMLGVDVVVIGQRRTSSILSKLSGGTGGKDMAEFLIEHSKCLCVGVQKKGQNAGYLLNTKTHKNFWLLA